MLRLFLPQICVHCGAHCDDGDVRKKPLAKYLCKVCFRQFELFEPPLPEDLSLKTSILRSLPFEVRLGCSFRFENQDIIQSLIHHFKYMDMPNLARAIGAECCR